MRNVNLGRQGIQIYLMNVYYYYYYEVKQEKATWMFNSLYTCESNNIPQGDRIHRLGEFPIVFPLSPTMTHRYQYLITGAN